MSGGERGLTAVLFTDVVGSTAMRTQLGADAAEALRREHDATLARVVEHHGGRVVKGQGDGVMATFSSTVSAADAAVAMQQAVDRLARQEGLDLQIRVGISVGDVSLEGDDVFGEPVIEASRLCAEAAGRQILCSDLVPALTRGQGGHSFVAAGVRELKGFPQPVAVSELAWEPAGAEVPLPPLVEGSNGPIAFVGRAEQIGVLDEERQLAFAGQPRLVMVSGEPGMGKTRMVAEFARRLHGDGALVLAGRCDEDLGVPYQPFVEALRHHVAHLEPDETAGALGDWAGELVRLVPELASRAPDLGDPLDTDPETARYRLFEAVSRWLTASSGHGLVLVLDDLHWAAKPTLLMLRHLVRSAPTARLLVIGTYRHTDLDRMHPLAQMLGELRKESNVTRLALEGLDLAETESLMEAAAGHEMDEDGRSLAVALKRETNGLPLFVQQVLAHLSESGAIVQSDGRWRPTSILDEGGLPEGIREVIGLRLARLREETNRVLVAAAVIGPDVPHDLLHEVCDAGADEVDDALREAIDAGLLTEADRGAVVYQFPHALVRATLLEELRTARRVMLHRRTGEAIERLHGGEDPRWLPALAHHFSEAAPGGDAERALRFRIQAGRHALDQHADGEAIAHFGAALGLIEDLDVRDDQIRFDASLGLARAEMRAMSAGWMDRFADAAELARRLGDGRVLALAEAASVEGVLVERDDRLVRLMTDALEVLGRRPGADRARMLVRQYQCVGLRYGLDHLRRVDLLPEVQRCLASDGFPPRATVEALFWLDVHVPATEYPDYVARFTEAEEFVSDPTLALKCASTRFVSAIRSADLPAARQARDDLDRRSREVSEDLRWAGYLAGACLAQLAGDLETAQATLEANSARFQDLPGPREMMASQVGFVLYETGQLHAIAEYMIHGPLHPEGKAPNAVGLLSIGRIEEARSLYEPVIDAVLADVPRGPLGQDVGWAEACYRLGDARRAPRAYERLVPHAGQVGCFGPSYVYGAVDRALGLLAVTMGELDTAVQHFETAQAIHAALEAPLLAARTEIEWADALLRRGRHGDEADARARLDAAVATGDTHGAAAVGQRAGEIASSHGIDLRA